MISDNLKLHTSGPYTSARLFFHDVHVFTHTHPWRVCSCIRRYACMHVCDQPATTLSSCMLCGLTSRTSGIGATRQVFVFSDPESFANPRSLTGFLQADPST